MSLLRKVSDLCVEIEISLTYYYLLTVVLVILVVLLSLSVRQSLQIAFSSPTLTVSLLYDK